MQLRQRPAGARSRIDGRWPSASTSSGEAAPVRAGQRRLVGAGQGPLGVGQPLQPGPVGGPEQQAGGVEVQPSDRPQLLPQRGLRAAARGRPGAGRRAARSRDRPACSARRGPGRAAAAAGRGRRPAAAAAPAPRAARGSSGAPASGRPGSRCAAMRRRASAREQPRLRATRSSSLGTARLYRSLRHRIAAGALSGAGRVVFCGRTDAVAAHRPGRARDPLERGQRRAYRPGGGRRAAPGGAARVSRWTTGRCGERGWTTGRGCALRVWQDWPQLERALPELGEPFLLTAAAPRTYWEPRYPERTVLLLGRESVGLSPELLARFPERTVRLPMMDPAAPIAEPLDRRRPRVV